MRKVCTALMARYPRLQCVEGSAEQTGLAGESVALVTVAQAMHWFDVAKARQEFARILKPVGWCAVIYNNRRMEGDAFHIGYEQLLREFGADYMEVKQRHMGRKRLAEFFAPQQMRSAALPNEQDLTLEMLMGRVMSSSYMPQPGDERYPAMAQAVEGLFARHQNAGQVRMEYETVVCWGRL